MQQPSATIANLDGPRTDDRRAPPQKSQTSQPHRPAWWTPGGGERKWTAFRRKPQQWPAAAPESG
eukprot:3288351-Pleurochrysis_carterae.AAC.1